MYPPVEISLLIFLLFKKKYDLIIKYKIKNKLTGNKKKLFNFGVSIISNS